MGFDEIFGKSIEKRANTTSELTAKRGWDMDTFISHFLHTKAFNLALVPSV